MSWGRAWRRGLGIALHHRVLLLLVAIAVLCERAVSLAASPDPGLWGDWAAQLKGLVDHARDSGGLRTGAAVRTIPWTLFPAAGVFLFGMLLLIGVVTLIRDLLLDGCYQTRRVLGEGGRYFWPILRYKLPIYLATSTLSLLVAAALWGLWGQGPGRPVVATAGLSALWLLAFGVARVLLSLGTKVIVTESAPAARTVYRRVWRVVRADLGAVVVFYLLLLALTAATLAAVWGVSLWDVPLALRLAASVALMAAVTLVMKAAAFDLYLQLARRVDAAASDAV